MINPPFQCIRPRKYGNLYTSVNNFGVNRQKCWRRDRTKNFKRPVWTLRNFSGRLPPRMKRTTRRCRCPPTIRKPKNPGATAAPTTTVTFTKNRANDSPDPFRASRRPRSSTTAIPTTKLKKPNPASPPRLVPPDMSR